MILRSFGFFTFLFLFLSALLGSTIQEFSKAAAGTRDPALAFSPAQITPTPDPSLDAEEKFKRLLKLQDALKRIPSEKLSDETNRKFIKANEGDIVYSDPSAEYYVRSERFWELFEKSRQLPVAEEIAWAAARNPLPGECEGYLNCMLYTLILTDGKYLKHYPNGKYAKSAFRNTSELLKALAGDSDGETGPTDQSDKAELNAYLKELTEVTSKVNDPGKTSVMAHLKVIGERFGR